MKTRAGKIFASGMVLSVTALIMRTIGVGFNVYVSGKIGAAGMGLLTLIMSVYSLAVTFSVSGVSLAATRLTAESVGINANEEVRASMRRCLLYSASFGTTALILLFTFAEPVAIHWLGDVRCVRPIKCFAVSMPFVSMSSSIHGYFTAFGKAVKSATVSFLEQLVKIGTTVALLTSFADKGVEYACIAVLAGGSIAEIFSFVLALLVYRTDLAKNYPVKKGVKISGITGRLLKISLPVAFSSYIRTGLVSLEHMLIPKGLKRFGASSEKSLATYGVLQGMVLPIVLFPTAFFASFNQLLVPELARAKASGERRHITYIGERFLRFTLMFSVGICGIMICFSHELGFVIYNSHSAADYIKTVAPLIPIMYFDSAVDSMLKGLDEQLFNMRINIIDAATSVLMVYFLCPRIGIMGYIVTIFVSEIFNTACSTTRLLNVTEIRVKILSWFVKPLVCTVAACTFVRLLLEFSNGIAYSYPSLFLHLFLTLGIYFVFLTITDTLNRDDRTWIKSFFSKR